MIHLKRSEKLLQLIQSMDEDGKYLVAVCASPVILDNTGVITHRRVTVHPDHAALIQNATGSERRVEKDGHVIIGQAAGSTMEFAFKLVEFLFGKEKVKEVN